MTEPIVSEYIQLIHDSHIDWSQDISKGRNKQVFVKCGKCQEWRRVFVTAITNRIRMKKPFTGLCVTCSRKENPPPDPTGKIPGNFKGGRSENAEGYVRILLSTLPKDIQELIFPMSTLTVKRENATHNNSRYVTEHRLVMAVFLNRPLLSHEIVHHKNGDRADNRLENLELLSSRAEHPHGHEDELLNENLRLRSLLIQSGINPDE